MLSIEGVKIIIINTIARDRLVVKCPLRPGEFYGITKGYRPAILLQNLPWLQGIFTHWFHLLSGYHDISFLQKWIPVNDVACVKSLVLFHKYDSWKYDIDVCSVNISVQLRLELVRYSILSKKSILWLRRYRYFQFLMFSIISNVDTFDTRSFRHLKAFILLCWYCL